MDLRVCHAIAERRLLMFSYRGSVRVVEPHTYGSTRLGNEVLSAWLRAGWSRSEPEGGWRMFTWSETADVSILPEHFDGPRPRYNPGDPTFVEVFCRLSLDPVGDTAETTTGNP
jgi:hypothetical protein